VKIMYCITFLIPDGENKPEEVNVYDPEEMMKDLEKIEF